jgi:hypothetical protein
LDSFITQRSGLSGTRHYVSNFSGPVGTVIEPLDEYYFQIDRCELLTRIHAGHPVWTHLELTKEAQGNFRMALSGSNSEIICRAVRDAVVKIVDTPFGKCPFRVHVDSTQDGTEVVNMVGERVRPGLLRRDGLGDVLSPAKLV